MVYMIKGPHSGCGLHVGKSCSLYTNTFVFQLVVVFLLFLFYFVVLFLYHS